jgi:1,4-dihydroxy-2-naphthoate octaprenyltransferase
MNPSSLTLKPSAIWYQAIRPRSLTATYIPIALGGVLAWHVERFNALFFALALLGTLALQISANLFNEYFDYVKGVESGKTHGLGLILKNNLLTPRQVFGGAVLSLVIGAGIGLFFVWQTGVTILAIGMAAVLVVVLYTASPLALAYIGLGEVAVFIFMGPLIVFGTYFVMVERHDSLPLVAALPIGFLVAAILHANNLRDLEADKSGGKRTLAVRFGRRVAQAEYLALTLGAYMMTGILILLGQAPLSSALVLLTLPRAWQLCQTALSTEEAALLHPVLVGTARLHALFGLAYVLGWALNL